MEFFKTILVSALLVGTASHASAESVQLPTARVISCRIRVFAVLGQPPLEDTVLTEKMAPMNNPDFPNALLGEITYQSKDGLFKLNAQGLRTQHPSNSELSGMTSVKKKSMQSDYTPIWLTEVQSGVVISVSGNPDPRTKHFQDNDFTDVTAKFSNKTISVQCQQF